MSTPSRPSSAKVAGLQPPRSNTTVNEASLPNRPRISFTARRNSETNPAPGSDTSGKRAEATKTRAERRAEAKRARRQEGRRRGKQVGAPGRNLPPSDDPDEVVIHEPEQCSSCGHDLSGASEEGFERRQVFDAPQPTLICTKHRAGVWRELALAEPTSLDWQPPAPIAPNKRPSKKRWQDSRLS